MARWFNEKKLYKAHSQGNFDALAWVSAGHQRDMISITWDIILFFEVGFQLTVSIKIFKE